MSNINNISRINNMRMSGLATGLDVDGMIQKMLAAQQSRLDKAKQQREVVSWQKDSYRSVITKLNEFNTKFLDILSPKSMIKVGSFKQTKTAVPSSMSQYFSATSTSDAYNNSVTVNSIKQIATAQKVESAKGVSKPLSMSLNSSDVSGILGQSLSFSVNGETKNITLEKDIAKYQDEHGVFDIEKFADDINTKLSNTFGKQNGQAKVAIDKSTIAEVLNSESAVTGYKFDFKVADGNTVQISGSAAVTGALGFTSGATNMINLNSSLASVFGNIETAVEDAGKIKFSINEVAFEFSSSASVRDVINEINKSSAGVNISYSTLSDKFTIESTRTGEGDFIRLSQSEGSDFLNRMFGEGDNESIGNVTKGQNAVLTVNGEEIVRAGNSITMDGIAINLLQATPAGFNNTEAVTSKVDAAQVVDLIKNFVNDYNSLVSELTAIVGEKRPKANKSLYMPLTETQKSEMSEKDIASWEEMGKKGLLYNDPTISKMLSSLRMAVMGSVETENGKVSFASIGIKSSSYYEDNTGKLTIDEDALTKAIENDTDAVVKLFTQQSSVSKDAKMDDYYQKDANGQYYTTDANGYKKYVSTNDLQKLRDSSMGIAQKFAEIFTNNISTSTSNLGTLIRKVGTGTSILIDKNSSFDKKLDEMDKNITRIQNRLYAAEEKYYKQFSALETAIARMNNQATFLSGLDSGSKQ